MASFKLIVLIVAFAGLAAAVPTKTDFSSGLVEEMRSNCDDSSDSLACIKVRVMSFLDTIFKKDSFQVSDDIEVRQNGFSDNEISARSESGILDTVESYLKSHDVTFKVPVADAKVTISPRNINDNELNLKIKFNEETGPVEARKSKLKKVFIPILVFVLLKAMTLIPLALGVLGIKAWNALQLSFFSFIISVALSIFQLCKKIAHDNHHPQISAHGPWDHARSFTAEKAPEFDAQNLAYNNYA